MTREKAKDYDYSLDVDGLYYKDVENVIDQIFDYFESRSCDTCKYWRLWKKETNLHKCAGQNGCEIVGKDFYCSNWESKCT